jgi:Flp pilus assembly protein TadG
MKYRKHERGQSLVELAISMLFMLYLLAGVAEFGIIFFQYVQLRDAAQEGALYGSVNPQAYRFIEDRVRGASNSPINLADMSKVTVSLYYDNTLVWRNHAAQGSTNNDCEGHSLKVTATFQHPITMPFMSRFIRNPLPLTAEVTDTILSPTC